jgi:hypothetical protein
MLLFACVKAGQSYHLVARNAGNQHLALRPSFPRICVVFYSSIYVENSFAFCYFSIYVENSFAFCYFTVGFLLFFSGWDGWDEPDSSLCVCVCLCVYEGIHGGPLLQFVSWKKMTVFLLNALNASLASQSKCAGRLSLAFIIRLPVIFAARNNLAVAFEAQDICLPRPSCP